MAKQGGSFLYRMKMVLDDDQALSQLRSKLVGIQGAVDKIGSGVRNINMGSLRDQVRGVQKSLSGVVDQQQILNKTTAQLNNPWTNLGKNVQKVSGGLSGMQVNIESTNEKFRSLAKGFNSLPNSMQDVRQSIVASGNALEDMAAQDPFASFSAAPNRMKAFRRAIITSNNSIQNLAANSQQAWSNIITGTNSGTRNMQQLKQSIVQTSNAQQNLNQTSASTRNQFAKTSQTSQNLLRIMQDSQFGMLGMANNIQALGESLGRASTRGRSAFEQLRLGIKNLVTGPFAIPAAITAVTLLLQVDWDKIPEKVGQWNESFQNWIGTLVEAEEKLSSLQDQVDNLTEIEDEDVNDVFKQLGDLTGDAREEAVLLTKEISSNLSPAVQSARNEFQRLLQDAPRLTQQAARNLAQPGQTASEQMIGPELQEAAIQLRRMRAQRSQINQITQSLLQKDIKRDNLAQRLANEIQPLTVKQARQYLKLLQDSNEEADKQLDKLRRISVEGFDVAQRRQEIFEDEGGPIEQVRREFDRRVGEVQNEFVDKLEKLNERRQERVDELNERFSGTKLQARLDKLAANIQAESQKIRKQRNAIISFLREREGTAVQEAIDEEFQRRVEETAERLPDPPSGGFVFFQGEFVSKQKARKRIQRSLQERKALIEMESQRVSQRDQLGPQPRTQNTGLASTLMPGPSPGQVASHQMEILKAQKTIQQNRLQAQLNHIKKKKQIGADLSAQELALWKNKEQRKQQIEQKFADKRVKIQQQEAQKKFDIISNSMNSIAGNLSSASSTFFNTWLQDRKAELDATEKSEKEKRAILKEEGKKRFKMMKAMKITEASIAGLTAAVEAWKAGMSVGSGPAAIALAASMTAASLAATGAKIQKIASMSIGDRIGGGGGGSGGGVSASGSFSQLNQSVSARRASSFGTGRQRQRNNNEQKSIEKTAKRTGEEVAKNMPDKVTMDDRTAENANSAAVSRKDKLNK